MWFEEGTTNPPLQSSQSPISTKQQFLGSLRGGNDQTLLQSNSEGESRDAGGNEAGGNTVELPLSMLRSVLSCTSGMTILSQSAWQVCFSTEEHLWVPGGSSRAPPAPPHGAKAFDTVCLSSQFTPLNSWCLYKLCAEITGPCRLCLVQAFFKQISSLACFSVNI